LCEKFIVFLHNFVTLIEDFWHG